jgi:hypothetical protein
MSDKRGFDDEERLDRSIWIDGLPVTKNDLDGDASYVVQQWRVRVDKDRIAYPLHIPFFTDYDSIPPMIRRAFPRTFASNNISRLSALVHDILYKQGVAEREGVLVPVEKWQVDNWFYELHVNLIRVGYKGRFTQWIHIQRARLMYQMVAWFGKSTWDGYRAEEKAVKQDAVDSATREMHKNDTV